MTKIKKQDFFSAGLPENFNIEYDADGNVLCADATPHHELKLHDEWNDEHKVLNRYHECLKCKCQFFMNDSACTKSKTGQHTTEIRINDTDIIEECLNCKKSNSVPLNMCTPEMFEQIKTVINEKIAKAKEKPTENATLNLEPGIPSTHLRVD